MRYKIHLFAALAVLLSVGLVPHKAARAQHFDDCITNVNNATAQIAEDIESSFGAGDSLETGDEIALFTNDGVCAGMVTWEAEGTSVSAAGADSQQPEGYEQGEPLRFVIWDASASAEYSVEATYDPCGEDDNLCRDDGLYATDALYRVSALNAQALPVELTAFDVKLQSETALLQWRTASETNNAGFRVEHQAPQADGDEAAWTSLGFVEGHGTTTEAQAYAHRVEDLAPGVHRFRLQQMDFDGAFAYSPTVEVSVGMKETHRLSASYPNPFSARTRFALTVGQAQHVRVAVYNVLGQEVALLHDDELRANTAHSFTFASGALPSGLYLVRATGTSFAETQRVVLVK